MLELLGHLYLREHCLTMSDVALNYRNELLITKEFCR